MIIPTILPQKLVVKQFVSVEQMNKWLDGARIISGPDIISHGKTLIVKAWVHDIE